MGALRSTQPRLGQGLVGVWGCPATKQPLRDNNGSVGERKRRMAILKVPEQGGLLPLAPYFSHLLRSLAMYIPSTFQTVLLNIF